MLAVILILIAIMFIFKNRKKLMRRINGIFSKIKLPEFKKINLKSIRHKVSEAAKKR